MPNQIYEKIPFHVPIESNEIPLLKVFGYYCWFGGEVARHVEGPIVEGMRIANKTVKETNFVSTALKIASYILSFGVFPLLALLTLAILRGLYSFHYMSAPDIIKNEFTQMLQSEYLTFEEEEAIRETTAILERKGNELALQQSVNFQETIFSTLESFLNYPSLMPEEQISIAQVLSLKMRIKERELQFDGINPISHHSEYQDSDDEIEATMDIDPSSLTSQGSRSDDEGDFSMSSLHPRLYQQDASSDDERDASRPIIPRRLDFESDVIATASS